MISRQVDRKALVALTNAVRVFLDAMDKEETANPLPKDHGQRMARIANALNLENDKARYAACSISFSSSLDYEYSTVGTNTSSSNPDCF